MVVKQKKRTTKPKVTAATKELTELKRANQKIAAEKRVYEDVIKRLRDQTESDARQIGMLQHELSKAIRSAKIGFSALQLLMESGAKIYANRNESF